MSDNSDHSGLVNIAYLTDYYTSSCSPKWSSHRSGEPNDHHQGTGRFSFHTDVEESPFIHFSLPAVVLVTHIVVRLRDKYGNKSLPIDVMVRRADEPWEALATLTEFLSSQIVPTDRTIDAVRLARQGVGTLDLPGVDILTKQEDFLSLVQRIRRSDELLLVHVPWYGLGGQLAVCASAIDTVRQSGVKTIAVNGLAGAVIDYPPTYDETPQTRALILDSLAPSAARGLLGTGTVSTAAKGIAQWRDEGFAIGQKRPLILVTRDNLRAVSGESFSKMLRRVYGPIIPSPWVIQQTADIEARFAITAETYDNALGIHLRHGNGERYFSSDSRQWGVKPPSISATVEAVRSALAGGGVTTVLVASDLPVAAEMLQEYFSHLTFLNISDGLQPVGSGCSHNTSVFDKSAPRHQHGRVANDNQAMIEILLLSRCKRVCGGRSFFFHAVQEMAKRSDTEAFSIPNGDRYIVLDAGSLPLAETPLIEGKEILSAFRRHGILTDGIFLTEVDCPEAGIGRQLMLTYFDVELAKGGIEAIVKYLGDEDLHGKLRDHRWYVSTT